MDAGVLPADEPGARAGIDGLAEKGQEEPNA